MHRTHAPIIAAALGAGLVIVATRSPEADATAAMRDVGVIEAPVRPDVQGVATNAEATAPREGGTDAFVPGRVSVVSDVLVIERLDLLAGFRVPRDRLVLSAETHAPSTAPLTTEGATIVALVASWCRPCARELPLLTQLAQTSGARLVLVSLDDVAGPESLAAVVEDLFARAEPSSRLIPRYELRADPDGAWTDATAPLISAAGGDPGALPQSLVLSGDGALVMLVQGQLDEDVARRAETHIAATETHVAVCR